MVYKDDSRGVMSENAARRGSLRGADSRPQDERSGHRIGFKRLDNPCSRVLPPESRYRRRIGFAGDKSRVDEKSTTDISTGLR